MHSDQPADLLLGSLQYELGKLEVFEAAWQLAWTDTARAEWKGYMEQTRRRVERLRARMTELPLAAEHPEASATVRDLTDVLVTAMKVAAREGERTSVGLVASECLALAEQPGHFDWGVHGEATEIRRSSREAKRGSRKSVAERDGKRRPHDPGVLPRSLDRFSRNGRAPSHRAAPESQNGHGWGPRSASA